MFTKEPAVILGAIAEIIKAVIPMLIIFAILHWSADQVAAVMLVVNVSVGALTVVLTRSQTTPTPQVDALIKTAVLAAPNTSVAEVKQIQAEKDSNQ